MVSFQAQTNLLSSDTEKMMLALLIQPVLGYPPSGFSAGPGKIQKAKNEVAGHHSADNKQFFCDKRRIGPEVPSSMP